MTLIIIIIIIVIVHLFTADKKMIQILFLRKLIKVSQKRAKIRYLYKKRNITFFVVIF